MADGANSAVRFLGVDTGGTFTDLVQLGGPGGLRMEKSFSTPARPEQAVRAVLDQLAASERVPLADLLAATVRFAHGTTVSTNALIQRKGARVGLLTTFGFEDTLEIARGPIGRAGGLPQSRAMDFLHTEPPVRLVPRTLVRGLRERVTVSGEVLMGLDEDEAASAIAALLDQGVESLAVCLLWSFRHPAHEQLVRRIAGRVAPGLPISLSCEIAPRLGEFERATTTVVNAYVGPATERYIGALQADLDSLGLANPVQVMKSSGGVTLPGDVARQAVAVINSGPIGGLVAARHLGTALGLDNVITADMGGTSFDVGLIVRGDFEEDPTPFIDQGLPVLIPSIKLVTIGAGGGSIASTDGTRLRVGPQSAGAEPGPACYGRGGTAPTVTDALVVMGIIDGENFFGGRFRLVQDLARHAIETRIARPLGLDVMDSAAGIVELVNARMADLIRKVTVESGNDPREFCLFAYGGAGGAHSAAVAAQLGIARVLIPCAAPVFSALGVALSDVLYSYTMSDPVALDAGQATLDAFNNAFAALEDRALADAAASGIAAAELTLSTRVDMRYQGQMNEVSLPWQGGRLDHAGVARLQQAFEDYYQQRFGAGTTRPETPLELISYRLDALKPTEKPPLVRLFDGETGARPEPVAERDVYQRETGWTAARIYQFDRLEAGMEIGGPAVIERDTTTIWIPAGHRARLDLYGNLDITEGG